LQTIDSTIIETSWCSSIDSIPKNIVKGKTPEIEIVGDIITTEGEIVLEETVGFIIIENSPRFKEAENLSKGKAKKDFDERMNNFVQDNFDISWTNNLGLSEKKYKIFTQFTIDEKGVVIDIKVRAPHPKIKKEVLKMIKNLPQFIPGEQSGKAIKTKYSLPITFIID
jgi:protein TonB